MCIASVGSTGPGLTKGVKSDCVVSTALIPFACVQSIARCNDEHTVVVHEPPKVSGLSRFEHISIKSPLALEIDEVITRLRPHGPE